MEPNRKLTKKEPSASARRISGKRGAVTTMCAISWPPFQLTTTYYIRWLYASIVNTIKTSVSETIRKPPLIKSQTALKTKKINMAKNDFQYGGWNSYTLQCGTITTLISSGDCTLQCGMWLWNRDSEFTKWQHPAMWYWYVALGWHANEFAQWQ